MISPAHALVRELHDAGLDLELMHYQPRGLGDLRVGDTRTTVWVTVTPTSDAPDPTLLVQFSDGQRRWARALIDGEYVSDVQVAVTHVNVTHAAGLLMDGYATGLPGDLRTLTGQVIPHMNGEWLCFEGPVPEWAPLKDLSALHARLDSDAGYGEIEPYVLGNGRCLIVGTERHRFMLDGRKVRRYLPIE